MSPLLLVLGCGWTAQPEPPPRVPLPPPVAEGPVWTARVTEAPRAVPARMTAAVGRSPDAMRADPARYPPLGAVAFRLCHGDRTTRGQVWAAIVASPDDERAAWGQMLSGCSEPGFCDWVLDTLEAAEPAVAVPLWDGMAGCPGERAHAALEREDAPPDAVVLWSHEHGQAPDARLEAATVATLQNPQRFGTGVFGLRVFADDPDPASGAALLRIHRQVHPAYRDLVAQAMWGRDDPDLQVLHRRACQRAAHPDCGRRRVDALADPAAAVADPGVDLEALLAEHATYQGRIVAALQGCVQGGAADPFRADACLRAWATVDRPAAVAAAQDAAWTGEAQAALAGWPEPGALAAHLQQLGFAEVSAADAVTVLDALQQGGAALDPLRLDSMDALLRQLLALAGASEVPVQVLLPFPGAQPTARQPRVTLHAWVDGVRLRSLADSRAGEPDLRTAVAFANAVLARHGAEKRLAFTDWPVAVVAGPPPALAALEDAGLIAWSRPPEWTGELVDTGP